MRVVEINLDLEVLCFAFEVVAFFRFCPVLRKIGCSLDIFAFSCRRFTFALSLSDLKRSVTL
jgi:hypothetical protein